jgi:hypothetical protein
MVEGFVKQVAWRVLSSYTLSSGKKKAPCVMAGAFFRVAENQPAKFFSANDQLARLPSTVSTNFGRMLR